MSASSLTLRDTEHERALWAAVLTTAFDDLAGRTIDLRSAGARRMAAEDARAFLLGAERRGDLERICEVVGVEVDAVVEHARGIVERRAA